MKTTIIIPARYESFRLPGKPLVEIDGVPMISRVMSRSLNVGLADQVVIATDDERIANAARDSGDWHPEDCRIIMTSKDCRTGSDRCAEAARIMGLGRSDIVVNVQGDMPFFPPQLCFDLIRFMERATYPIVTPAIRRQKPQIGGVQVVIGNNDQALYFSRHPLLRNGAYHMGMYAFTNRTLQKFASLPQSPCEVEESLEQLRALHYGIPIGVMMTKHDCGREINTPEDLG